jgi:putative transposase
MNIKIAPLAVTELACTPRTAGPRSTALCRGARYVHGGRVVVITRVLDLSRIEIIDEATAVLQVVQVEALGALPALAGRSPLATYNEEAWERAQALHLAFAPYLDRGRLEPQLLMELSQHFGLGPRQLERLWARYRCEASIEALLPGREGRRPGSGFLSETTEQAISHVIAKCYLRREVLSVAQIIVRARSLCRRLHAPVPSPNAVRRRLRSLDVVMVEKARVGRSRAEKKYLATPGGLNVETALHVCQIDHTLVDQMVLSEDRSIVLGRPWLTIALDVATRMVLGMYLSMDAPSSESVALCIEHAILPKRAENAQHPGRWPCYGKMQVIHVDNAKELRSDALKRGCRDLGIDIQWRPVKTPRYGAHIERFMGTLMRLTHGLPGTTFSNTRMRGDYPSEQRATMTLNELSDWLTIKICQYYHVRTHRSLGTAPILAWEAQFRHEDGTLRLPAPIACPDRVRITLLPCVRRTVQRDGIHFSRTRYWNPELAAWLGTTSSVAVHYRPRALGTVWARNDLGDFFELKAVEGRAIGKDLRDRSPNADEVRRLEGILDNGLLAADALEDAAATACRQVPVRSSGQKVVPGRGGLNRLTVKTAVDVQALPMARAAPNRASIRIEEDI